MNIIKVQGFCPSCRLSFKFTSGPWTEKTIGACAHNCERTLSCQFIETTTYGQKPEPHFHAKCHNCEFEWLEEVPNLESFKSAW